jgi:hypothetical protein
MPALADLFKTCYLTGADRRHGHLLPPGGGDLDPARLGAEHAAPARQCFSALFSLRRTSATRILASAVRRLPPARRALTGHRGPAKRVTAPAHYR